jgi:DNA-binding transcriptional LysR family regulator
VGVFQSVGARFLPLVMRRFSEQWPSVEVKLVEDEDTPLNARVERGEVDLAFAVPPVDGPFEIVELLRDPHYLVVSKDSDLAARRTPIKLRDLRTLPMLSFQPTVCTAQRQLEENLRGRGIDLDITFRSNDNRVIQSFVEAGMGTAIMPALCIEPTDEIVLLETEPRLPPRWISLIWHRDRYQSPAARAFVEEARKVGAELSAAATESALSAA